MEALSCSIISDNSRGRLLLQARTLSFFALRFDRVIERTEAGTETCTTNIGIIMTSEPRLVPKFGLSLALSPTATKFDGSHLALKAGKVEHLSENTVIDIKGLRQVTGY